MKENVIDTIRVFNKSHKSRRTEAAFRDHIATSLGAEFVDAQVRPTASYSLIPIDSLQVRDWLERDSLLPSGAKHRCLKSLQSLPKEVFIANRLSDISYDFRIESPGWDIFVEFHEAQHRQLSDRRPKPVYDDSGRTLYVPRGLQRLLRDLWRIQVSQNLVIVWSDWFEANRDSFELTLAGGFQEYGLTDRFSFTQFCS